MFAPGPRAVGFTIVWPEGVIFRSMMTYHVQFLLLVLAGWVNRQQQDVIDYLQEENRVLRAGLRGKRLSLSDDDRRRLAVKAQALGREALAQIASVATPATLRRRCRRFAFPVRAGKTPSSNGMPSYRAKAWIQAWGKMDMKESRAAPGPERARAATPTVAVEPRFWSLGWPLFRRRTALSAAHHLIWRKRGDIRKSCD